MPKDKKQMYPRRALNTLGAKLLKGKSQAELDKEPNRYLSSAEVERDFGKKKKKPKGSAAEMLQEK